MGSQWLDDAYGDYHAWKGWKDTRDTEGEIARAVAELRMARISPPARLLEIGFGDGAFLQHAQSLGYRCAGLERDTSSIAELTAQGIDARVGTPDRFSDKMFDVIVAFDVFEHIAIPELILTLHQLADLLDKKGRLVARFPNMASPFGLINQYGDVTHITGLSPGSFAQLARMAGFEMVGVANGVTILRGGKGLRALVKPVALAVRKMIELVLSFAYYGKMTPLSPSVVVVMRKNGRHHDSAP